MNRREFLDKLNKKILSNEIGTQCAPVGLEPDDYKEFIEHITPLYKELYGGLITADFEFENVIYGGRIVFLAPSDHTSKINITDCGWRYKPKVVTFDVI